MVIISTLAQVRRKWVRQVQGERQSTQRVKKEKYELVAKSRKKNVDSLGRQSGKVKKF